MFLFSYQTLWKLSSLGMYQSENLAVSESLEHHVLSFSDGNLH